MIDTLPGYLITLAEHTMPLNASNENETASAVELTPLLRRPRVQMPPPQATYLARTSNTGYDPATLSDDEDDATTTDAASVSSSTWSAAAVTTLAVLDGPIPVPTENATELRDWKISRVGGEPVRPTAAAPAAGAFPATTLLARSVHSLLHWTTTSAVVIAGQHGITGLTTPFSHTFSLSLRDPSARPSMLLLPTF